MTDIDTSEYVTAAEAARIMGVSRQRITAMVHDNDLDHVRPWPRKVLIVRASLDRWMSGERRTPIHKTAVRQWIITREGVDTLDMLNPHYLWNVTREFIDNQRPEWDETSKNNWTTAMAGLLTARPGVPR